MRNYITTILFVATSLLSAQNATLNINNEKWKGGRPDGHAPISVMADHTHSKGELMFSYRFMSMAMENINSGRHTSSPSHLLKPNGGNYMVAPVKMPMNMSMLGVMYAPSNRITLSVMANYMTTEMDHLTAMDGKFTTKSAGFGDAKLAMLYQFFNANKKQLHGKLGVSLPTGAIDNKDVTAASVGQEVILPYGMQIGSGTFDAELGLTFLIQSEVVSFGSQFNGVIRLGENSNNYTLGNRYSLNNWFAVKAANWMSFSARVEGLAVEQIKGANPTLHPGMIITADTYNSGGRFINSGVGFNLYVPSGAFKDLRLGFEYAIPVYQNVNGSQLQTKETITLGLQYAL